MAYIGREPQIGNYQICDTISVVNGQAAYTMQVSSTNVIPESVNHMIVSLNGVIQKPGSSYTISSSTITFSSNLATGDSIDFIYLLGNVLDLGTPSDSTVTTAKLSGNLVTPGTLDVNGQELILDADADTSITADTDDQIDIKVAGADDFQITANTLTALSGSTIKADTIAETTSANGVAVDGLTIKDGKLNTNDSVVTANITDANVTSAKIAGDAITAAKIADDAISDEHLDVTTITGQTAETSIADGDTILIHDASASALRKMTKANFTAGVGETNSPYFRAYMGGTNTLADNTTTRVVYDSVSWNVGGTYSTSNHRWTPGTAGRYFINAKVQIDFADTSANRLDLILRKNGSNVNYHRVKAGGDHQGASSVHMTCTVDLDGDDYVEIFAEQDSNAGKTYDGTSQYNWWEGFLISKT